MSTTNLTTGGASAAASSLDLSPKAELQETQKTIKKLVRRNASDKLKLIQMVHDMPILWDSRLPNFKGAEEEKNRAWEQIGREFNAPGRRVARAFKSLRESYRRELAHVKIMGTGFKPKWSLYESMDFLRDVIRERKGGAHAADQVAMGLNLSAISQHIANNINNNNNNNSSNNNNNNNSTNSHSSKNAKTSTHLNTSLQSSLSESALNLSKCSNLRLSGSDDYYYFVKPELDITVQAAAAAAQPVPAHQNTIHAHQHQRPPHTQMFDSLVTSSRNDNNAAAGCEVNHHNNNSSIFDDLDASSLRSGDDDTSTRNAELSHQGSDAIEQLEAIDADFPYPLILDSNSRSSHVGGGGSAPTKRRRRCDNDDDNVDADSADGYEGQMLQQHRHLRQQNGSSGSGLDMPPPQTVREVLNSKFCGFISAKLNSMEDSEADNLMNKILMLLVQTQGNGSGSC